MPPEEGELKAKSKKGRKPRLHPEVSRFANELNEKYKLAEVMFRGETDRTILLSAVFAVIRGGE